MLRCTSIVVVLFAAVLPAAGQQQSNRPQTGPEDKPWVLFGKKEATPSKEQERIVRGQVTDAEGNIIEGAVVEVKPASAGKVISMVTNRQGRYEITGLFKDQDYEVKATQKGLGSVTRKVTRFDARKEVQINFRLGAASETTASAEQK